MSELNLVNVKKLKPSFTPLLRIAAEQGYFDFAEMLVQAGASVETGLGISPLCLAIQGGHYALARMLLRSGARPSGFALRLAVEANELNLVEALLKRGADYSEDDDYAVRYAIRKRYFGMEDLLLSYGADKEIALATHNPDNADYLIQASGEDALFVVELLLKNNYGKRLSPALAYAADNGALHTVRLLLRYGADATFNHESPLINAVLSDEVEVAELLLRSGASPYAIYSDQTLSFEMAELLAKYKE